MRVGWAEDKEWNLRPALFPAQTAGTVSMQAPQERLWVQNSNLSIPTTEEQFQKKCKLKKMPSSGDMCLPSPDPTVGSTVGEKRPNQALHQEYHDWGQVEAPKLEKKEQMVHTWTRIALDSARTNLGVKRQEYINDFQVTIGHYFPLEFCIRPNYSRSGQGRHGIFQRCRS